MLTGWLVRVVDVRLVPDQVGWKNARGSGGKGAVHRSFLLGDRLVCVHVRKAPEDSGCGGTVQSIHREMESSVEANARQYGASFGRCAHVSHGGACARARAALTV